MILSTFAQTDLLYSTSTTTSSGISAAVLVPFILIYVAVIALMVVSLWKVFVKTGRPGWASIVPVYNIWVLLEIVGYPGWWALLSFVPVANIFPIVMTIVAYFKLAKLFGKSDGFAVCSIFFPLITMPILAFGSSTFQDVPLTTAPAAPQAPGYPTAVQQSAPIAPQAIVAPEVPQADLSQSHSLLPRVNNHKLHNLLRLHRDLSYSNI